MATDKPQTPEALIDQLAGNLAPVKPLRSPLFRAAIGSAIALVCVFLAIFVFTKGFRPDIAQKVAQPGYASQTFSILLAGLMAAFAAFKLSVPDTRIRPAVYAMLLGATGIWAIQILALSYEGGWSNIEVAERDCLTDLALFMVVPLTAVGFMMTRSAPIWRGWAGYATVLSVASFSALGMRTICPSDSPGHLLVWHFLPVIIFALIGILLGRVLLNRMPSHI